MILWPCLVSFPNGSQQSACKVYYSPSGCEVWAWNTETQKAEVIAAGPRLEEETRDVWILPVDGTGDVRIVVDTRDCGCGHPLRYFRPAAPVLDG